MLTRFFFVVLILVGIGVFAIEYQREDDTTGTAAAPQLDELEDARVVNDGVWLAKSYEASGKWQIVRSGDTYFVELDESFATRNAPDLKIFLSPLALADLSDSNATNGALFVSALAGNEGAQRLAVPAGTNISDYQTIIIHCEQFSKLWSGATLQ